VQLNDPHLKKKKRLQQLSGARKESVNSRPRTSAADHRDGGGEKKEEKDSRGREVKKEAQV